MNKKIHFISGMPRSGSTLLSTILNQNPRFSADISDPLLDFVNSMISAVNTNVGMSDVVGNERLLELIRDLFDSYYKHHREVCFNTNRGWTAQTSLIKQIYPDFKMIVCVRSIPWILDSFERLHRKNPLTVKPLYDHQMLGSVYDRSHALMGMFQNVSGRVKGPLDFVKQAINCEERNQLLFVQYDALAKLPEKVMPMIYDFLGEEYFEHDFGDVAAEYPNYDSSAKIEGLHTVRKEVQMHERDTILPKDLFDHYLQDDAWMQNKELIDKLKFIRLAN
jgi:sulfotransferase